MAERTLVENVAQVKADFKSVREAINYAIPKGTPTSEYGERIHNEISNLMSQADSNYNYGFEVGRTEGIEQGKQEVISNSKYIEKTASGKVIRLDDVSEVYHNVKVKADTPTEVKVCGKNLFNIDDDTRFTKQSDGSYISNTTITAKKIPLSLPYGTYTYSYDISCKTGINGRLSIGFKDGTRVEVYAASDGTFKHTEKTVTGEIVNWSFQTSVLPVAGEMTIKNIQLEVGSASPYEPYKKQTITATAEGTETPSMCPTMTFIADNDVTVDYYGSYGMQTEYDRFWNSYQDYGKRTSYAYGFSNQGWNDETFKPKYDIALTNYCFYNCRIKNLASALSKQGVRMTSSATSTNLTYAFAMSWIEHIPEVDMSKATVSDSMFSQGSSETSRYLKNIEKIISSEKTVFANNCFNRCSTLEHCIFEGTIASDINLQWSTKLDLESLISLFRCIKTFWGTDEAYTKTITLSAESWALTETQEFLDEFDGQEGKMLAHYFGWNVA